MGRSSGEVSADEKSAQEDDSQGSACSRRSIIASQTRKSRTQPKATIDEVEVQLDIANDNKVCIDKTDKDKKKRNVRF